MLSLWQMHPRLDSCFLLLMVDEGLTFLFLPPHAADANILINICRTSAQRYYFAYQEPMPVEQLVRSVCDTKQVRGLSNPQLL